ncbi:uncharacterized protein N7482_006694 [Penicillium canariense]|uniref:Uncharacterized protein n=1 Tax=Penicillium canariense TaxID=189055 RepID=A0A9W9HXS7_9EURO|nr:uncharacterized protein N7482_006694 [Penicillium canariense]KAJ5159690.1 hypothetical protein N7482_006694 [Penicillium canariense]
MRIANRGRALGITSSDAARLLLFLAKIHAQESRRWTGLGGVRMYIVYIAICDPEYTGRGATDLLSPACPPVLHILYRQNRGTPSRGPLVDSCEAITIREPEDAEHRRGYLGNASGDAPPLEWGHLVQDGTEWKVVVKMAFGCIGTPFSKQSAVLPLASSRLIDIRFVSDTLPCPSHERKPPGKQAPANPRGYADHPEDHRSLNKTSLGWDSSGEPGSLSFSPPQRTIRKTPSPQPIGALQEDVI